MTTTIKKYAGERGEGEFRPMTIDEACRLIEGTCVWFLSSCGDARQAKVTGPPKTWKESPKRIEIPVKYGIFEDAIFNERDVAAGILLVEGFATEEQDGDVLLPHVAVSENPNRMCVKLLCGDKIIAEWGSDAARRMIEDGYFDRQRLGESVIIYARRRGLIT